MDNPKVWMGIGTVLGIVGLFLLGGIVEEGYYVGGFFVAERTLWWDTFLMNLPGLAAIAIGALMVRRGRTLRDER